MSYKEYGKAISGAALAGLGAAGVAITDGVIDPAEWIAIAIAVITAGAVVFSVPNKVPEGEIGEFEVPDGDGEHRQIGD